MLVVDLGEDTCNKSSDGPQEFQSSPGALHVNSRLLISKCRRDVAEVPPQQGSGPLPAGFIGHRIVVVIDLLDGIKDLLPDRLQFDIGALPYDGSTPEALDPQYGGVADGVVDLVGHGCFLLGCHRRLALFGQPFLAAAAALRAALRLVCLTIGPQACLEWRRRSRGLLASSVCVCG